MGRSLIPREIDAQGCHVAIMAERIDGGCRPPRRGGGVWPRVERSGTRGEIAEII